MIIMLIVSFSACASVWLVQASSNIISGNTTWIQANSPYIVTSNITVLYGVTLTIEPGVVIKFTSGAGLIIDGDLIAQGNVTNRIRFTTNAAVSAQGDWAGIWIRQSGHCNITNSILEYATQGINFEARGHELTSSLTSSQVRSNIVGIRVAGDSIILDKLAIENNTDSGAHSLYGGGSITNSIISNNNIGISGADNITNSIISNNDIGISGGGSITNSIISNNNIGIMGMYDLIKNCTISNNMRDGIYGGEAAASIIEDLLDSDISNNGRNGIYNYMIKNCNHCRISNNSGDGIYARPHAPENPEYFILYVYNSNITNNSGNGVRSSYTATIVNSTISNNDKNGVLSQYVDISSTNIIDNGKSGIVTLGSHAEGAWWVYGWIRFCNIYNNGLYEVMNNGSNTIEANYNWWGTTNGTLVRKGVYDYYSNPTVGSSARGIVNTSWPFLNSSKATLTVFTSGVSSNEPVSVMKNKIKIGQVSDGEPLSITFYSGPSQCSMGTLSLGIDSTRTWGTNPSFKYSFVKWAGPAGNSSTRNPISLMIVANSSITAFYNTKVLCAIEVAPGGLTYMVRVDANSTVSAPVFNQTQKQLGFNITGLHKTTGYCNVTIPKNLLGGPFTVFLNGTVITHVLTENSTHAFVYFNYNHSTHSAQIIGTTAVPEFPTIFATTLLFTILTIMLTLTRRIGRLSRQLD